MILIMFCQKLEENKKKNLGGEGGGIHQKHFIFVPVVLSWLSRDLYISEAGFAMSNRG